MISIGLMFDEIIMNILRNKALGLHVEVADIYFPETENNKMYMYRWSL